MLNLPGFAIGIYEKALPASQDWSELLSVASRTGFDFVEMSIDPSPNRLRRLDWTHNERIKLRHQMESLGMAIHSICLSAHRESPLGSSEPAVRKFGLEILQKSIDLAHDLGIRLIQLAGYDTWNGPSTDASKEHYRDGLRRGVDWASQAGVLLGLENQERGYIDSITTASKVVRAIDSPYLGLYSDVGNLIVNGLDIKMEIPAAKGILFGVHIKDTKPGVPRRVPFGEGRVPFELVFEQLLAIGFRGILTVEMWNDNLPEPEEICRQANVLVKKYLEDAWRISISTRT